MDQPPSPDSLHKHINIPKKQERGCYMGGMSREAGGGRVRRTHSLEAVLAFVS